MKHFTSIHCVGVGETAYSSSDDPVKFYTSLGYYVAGYNYRGSGESTGIVNPQNAVSDARRVCQFMTVEYHTQLTLIHGRSIGGYVVSNFCQETNSVIYDRNFASMDELIYFFVRIYSILIL